MNLAYMRKLEKLAGIRSVEYFRQWDPRTVTGERRLLCFKYPGRDGFQEKISEAEYLAAVPDALPNAEIERRAGQRA